MNITAQNVKKGMILRESDSGHVAIIQALSDAVLSDKGTGKPNSFCEFEAVNLINGRKFFAGAAHPPAAYAPGLELMGISSETNIPKLHADNSYDTTGHNRTIKITGIPKEHPDDLDELFIQINYLAFSNDGNLLGKAIALDTHVIPAIVKALNNH